MNIFGDAKIQRMQQKGDVRGLIKKAQDRKHPGTRSEAINAFGELKAKEVVPLLIEFLQNYEDRYLSINIIKALGNIGVDQGVKAMANCFWNAENIEDTSWGATLLQNAVIDALAKINSQAAIEFLIELLGHPDENRRNEVVRALGSLGNPLAVDALGKLAKNDQSDWVRGSASIQLARIGDPRGIEYIAQAWPVTTSTTKEIIKDYLKEKIGQHAIDTLEAFLKEE